MPHHTIIDEVALLARFIIAFMTFPSAEGIVIKLALSLHHIIHLTPMGNELRIQFDFTPLYEHYIQFWRRYAITTPRQMFSVIKQYMFHCNPHLYSVYRYSFKDTLFTITITSLQGNWFSKRVKDMELYFYGYKCSVTGCPNYYKHESAPQHGYYYDNVIRYQPWDNDDYDVTILTYGYFAFVKDFNKIKRLVANIPNLCEDVCNLINAYVDTSDDTIGVSYCGNCIKRRIMEGEFNVFQFNGYGDHLKLNPNKKGDLERMNEFFRHLRDNTFIPR